MPGAKMEEASGLTKVIAATKPRSVIFLFVVKLRGFAGSSCESQPTRLLSRSDSGYFSGASWSFLVLFLDRCFSRSAPISSFVSCGRWDELAAIQVVLEMMIGDGAAADHPMLG